MEDAFLVGLSAGCLVIGVLCLVGAVAAAIALPGTRHAPAAQPADADVVR